LSAPSTRPHPPLTGNPSKITSLPNLCKLTLPESHLYKNEKKGVIPHSNYRPSTVDRQLHPLLNPLLTIYYALFHSPYPATPIFAALTKTPGVSLSSRRLPRPYQGVSVANPSSPSHSPLSPLQSALPQNAPITLLQSALPISLDLKPCRIRTYEKRRREGEEVLTSELFSQCAAPAPTLSGCLCGQFPPLPICVPSPEC
jgi:hypothetical protein